MPEEVVHYDAGSGVATLTLDSPPNRNALSAALLAQLADGLDRALSDDTVRVVVLAHTGSVFSSGMDLKAAAVNDPALQPVHAFPRLLQRIWESPKPVLAKVAGRARAGGVGLIAACDIAVGASSGDFAFSEVRIGVVPAVISVPVLPRLLPRAAHELFLTGETFDATRAAAIGLLTRVVPDDELDAAVARYCGLLAAGGPRALAATKQLLRRTSSGSMADDFAELTELSAGFFASAEGQEGIAAFREKRRPAWVPD
jgi:methylglutaconyl-CoA hydratase